MHCNSTGQHMMGSLGEHQMPVLSQSERTLSLWEILLLLLSNHYQCQQTNSWSMRNSTPTVWFPKHAVPIDVKLLAVFACTAAALRMVIQTIEMIWSIMTIYVQKKATFGNNHDQQQFMASTYKLNSQDLAISAFCTWTIDENCQINSLDLLECGPTSTVLQADGLQTVKSIATWGIAPYVIHSQWSKN